MVRSQVFGFRVTIYLNGKHPFILWKLIHCQGKKFSAKIAGPQASPGTDHSFLSLVSTDFVLKKYEGVSSTGCSVLCLCVAFIFENAFPSVHVSANVPCPSDSSLIDVFFWLQACCIHYHGIPLIGVCSQSIEGINMVLQNLLPFRAVYNGVSDITVPCHYRQIIVHTEPWGRTVATQYTASQEAKDPNQLEVNFCNVSHIVQKPCTADGWKGANIWQHADDFQNMCDLCMTLHCDLSPFCPLLTLGPQNSRHIICFLNLSLQGCGLHRLNLAEEAPVSQVCVNNALCFMIKFIRKQSQ